MKPIAKAPASLPALITAEDAGYSDATRRFFTSNLRWWASFCVASGHPSHPPFAIDVVKAAVLNRVSEARARSTIDALLSTLSAASKAAGYPCPTHSQSFRDWLAVIRRKHLPRRQRQAKGMNYPDLQLILSTMTKSSARDARDGALILAAFDGLLRSNEISSLCWEDLSSGKDGAGDVLLRRSKTDQEGKGRRIFLSAQSMEWIAAWGTFGERRGRIFRSIRGEPSETGLGTRSIRRIFKERGLDAGVVGLSGHSARVGAAQDATAADVSLQALMVAGRWTNPKMPAKYGEAAEVSLLGRERLEAIQALHRKRGPKAEPT